MSTMLQMELFSLTDWLLLQLHCLKMLASLLPFCGFRSLEIQLAEYLICMNTDGSNDIAEALVITFRSV